MSDKPPERKAIRDMLENIVMHSDKAPWILNCTVQRYISRMNQWAAPQLAMAVHIYGSGTFLYEDNRKRLSEAYSLATLAPLLKPDGVRRTLALDEGQYRSLRKEVDESMRTTLGGAALGCADDAPLRAI